MLASYAPGCGPCGTPAGWWLTLPGPTPRAAGEVAPCSRRGTRRSRPSVRVRARDGLRVEVHHPRHEASRSAPRARRTCRARWAAGAPAPLAAGSSGWGTPTGTPSRPSPPRPAASAGSGTRGTRRPRFTTSSRMPSSCGPVNSTTLEVPVAVGRVHAQLPHVVAPLPRQVQPALALHRQPELRHARVRDEAVHQPARDEDVVLRRRSAGRPSGERSTPPPSWM